MLLSETEGGSPFRGSGLSDSGNGESYSWTRTGEMRDRWQGRKRGRFTPFILRNWVGRSLAFFCPSSLPSFHFLLLLAIFMASKRSEEKIERETRMYVARMSSFMVLNFCSAWQFGLFFASEEETFFSRNCALKKSAYTGSNHT